MIPKRVGIPALFRGRLRKERLQIESLEASERMGDFQTNRLKKSLLQMKNKQTISHQHLKTEVAQWLKQ